MGIHLVNRRLNYGAGTDRWAWELKEDVWWVLGGYLYTMKGWSAGPLEALMAKDQGWLNAAPMVEQNLKCPRVITMN